FPAPPPARGNECLDRLDAHSEVEMVEAVLTEPADLDALFEDVDVAFYLVRSMGGKDVDFEEQERRTAENVAGAADRAGVKQMIYLSGLHPRDRALEDLSKHMRSRERVAQILLNSDTPALILRAATLIGSGSASFEMIRHL